jgi:hypothetical protein
MCSRPVTVLVLGGQLTVMLVALLMLCGVL